MPDALVHNVIKEIAKKSQGLLNFSGGEYMAFRSSENKKEEGGVNCVLLAHCFAFPTREGWNDGREEEEEEVSY